jgi:hypothetical protein
MNRRLVGVQLEVVDVKSFLFSLAMGAALGVAVVAQAQNTVTATCKDGTSFSGTKRSGACRGHGGVQEFTTATSSTTTTPATTPTPAATAPATPPVAPSTKVASSKPAQMTPPPAGSAGQVWVNTASKVYHCPGTEWYGKTKKGEYMSEAAAKADGDRPDHGKTCS